MASPEDWLPIAYRDFYDVPRAFFVRYGDRWLFVAANFDEERDDFSDFAVFDMGDRGPDEVGDDWRNIEQLARECLGRVALTEASFDPTRRRSIAASALHSFSR